MGSKPTRVTVPRIFPRDRACVIVPSSVSIALVEHALVTTVDQHLRDDAARADASRHARPVAADRQHSATADEGTPAWRDADERLRLAVDAGNIGTWDFSPATGELAWSDHCQSLFGVTADEQPSLSLLTIALLCVQQPGCSSTHKNQMRPTP